MRSAAATRAAISCMSMSPPGSMVAAATARAAAAAGTLEKDEDEDEDDVGMGRGRGMGRGGDGEPKDSGFCRGRGAGSVARSCCRVFLFSSACAPEAMRKVKDCPEEAEERELEE